MPFNKRVAVVALAVVSLLLTAIGVALAASDSNSVADNAANLALHGKVPMTANASFVIDTGGPYQVTGEAALDFKHNRVAGSISIPTVFSMSTISVVVSNHQVYFGVPSLSSIVKKPWVTSPLPSGFDLFPVALTLAKIKVDLPFLRGIGHLTVKHDGALTTYTFVRHHLKLHSAAVGSQLKLPASVNVSLAITTASAGQLAAATLRVSTKSAHFSISLTILNYDHPVSITVPPKKDVTDLTKGLSRQFFGKSSSPLGQLLTPQGIASLGQIHVT